MKKMSSLQRCMSVINNELPDRVPVVPQAFLFASKEYGYNIGEINKNPRLLAESHIMCQEKYGYDGCVIDVDDSTLAEACGAKVIFRNENVAVIDESHPVLKNLSDIENMNLPDPLKDGRLPIWLETTKILSEKIGDNVFIMGRADQGPFGLACLLRGTEQFMLDLLFEDKEKIWKVLNWCANAWERFAEAQIDAGAHATSMGDSLAGPNLISPKMYREFALEHQTRVINNIQNKDKIVSLHICGNTNSIISDIVSTNAKIIELDWQVEMKTVQNISKGNAVLMGNIDPSDPLVMGTPEQVDELAKKIIEDTGGKRLFLSSGCAMGANTKQENMIALVNASKKYGTYDQIMELGKKENNQI